MEQLLGLLKEVFGGAEITWTGTVEEGNARTRERQAKEHNMARVGFGAKQQGSGGGGDTEFGELPEGTYPITMRWKKKFFENSQYGDGHSLKLRVTGEGVTDDLSAGSSNLSEVTEVDGGMGLDNGNSGWQLNEGTMSAFFLRDLEEACEEAGIEFDSADLGPNQGIMATIKHRKYPSSVAKRATYPSVRRVSAVNTSPGMDKSAVAEEEPELAEFPA